MIQIKSQQPLRLIVFPIEVNSRVRLPKSGVQIILGIKNKYADMLRKAYKNKFDTQNRFKTKIIVYKGKTDHLGKGDLDNYSKGVLDIITKSETIWKDDKQVDELHIIRKQTNSTSKIEITIKKI